MKMFPADIWEYPIPKIGNFSFRFLGKTLDEIHRRSYILTHGYDWSVIKGVYGEILGSSGGANR